MRKSTFKHAQMHVLITPGYMKFLQQRDGISRPGDSTHALVVNHQGGFLFTIFLVPKKGRGNRPIINLKRMNEFVPHHHFKMGGIHVTRLLEARGFLGEDRLERRLVPISKSDKKYLRFGWRDKIP